MPLTPALSSHRWYGGSSFHVYALAMVMLAGLHWGVSIIIQPRFEFVQVDPSPNPTLRYVHLADPCRPELVRPAGQRSTSRSCSATKSRGRISSRPSSWRWPRYEPPLPSDPDALASPDPFSTARLTTYQQSVVDRYYLRSLRVIICGAAPLGPGTEALIRERLPHVVMKQGYGPRSRVRRAISFISRSSACFLRTSLMKTGMTELSPSALATPSDTRSVRPGSVGLLLPNSTAKIVDPASGRLLNVDEEGELWIRGPHVMKGYLNNPQATAETIDTDGYLHTGDIARVDRDGYFYITDRLKELIKYNGHQVAPAELEEHLLSHPAVSDAAVVAVPDEAAGEVCPGERMHQTMSNLPLTSRLLTLVAWRIGSYRPRWWCLRRARLPTRSTLPPTLRAGWRRTR